MGSSIETLQTNVDIYIKSCTLPQHTKNLAKSQLNEDDCKIGPACLNLYKSVYKQHAILAEKFDKKLVDPKFLLRFLRAAKFNEAKAFSKLVEWLKTLNGDDWPELAERLKNGEKLIEFVKKTKLFLLENAVSQEIITTNQVTDNGCGSDSGPWLIISNTSADIRNSYENVQDYFLDVAASSIISVDYLLDKDEAAQIHGMYNANIIEDLELGNNNSGSGNNNSSLLFFIKNLTTFRKLIKIWTSTLPIRSKGSIKLNYQQSFLGKTFERLISPFLSEKVKNRNRKFGLDWLENNKGLFIKKQLPKHYGGELDDNLGLRWMEEYFKERERSI